MTDITAHTKNFTQQLSAPKTVILLITWTQSTVVLELANFYFH